MATTVILPMLGQTMEEGTIIQWFKQEGDKVEKGEPLLEVMTDKVNMEVESPDSGILRRIIAQPDETIPIMAPIAILGTADEPIDDLLAETPSLPSPAHMIANEEKGVLSPAPSSPALSVEAPTSTPSRVFISPRARRLAHESGLEIDALAGRGTGPERRVVEKDVRAYLASVQAAGTVKTTPLAAKIAADKGINLHEIVGTGTLFPDEQGNPTLHMHVAGGRLNSTITGCVRTGVQIWQVAEVVLVELLDTSASRKLEPALGFKLLQP